MKKIPHFKYLLSNPSQRNFGCIKANGDVVHRIQNVLEFYMALGYTADMGMAGVLPDEFIWAEYIKDNSGKSAACLQARIVEYLNKYSDAFRDKFGSQYAGWLGSCAAEALRNTADCTDCRMHPHHAKKRK